MNNKDIVTLALHVPHNIIFLRLVEIKHTSIIHLLPRIQVNPIETNGLRDVVKIKKKWNQKWWLLVLRGRIFLKIGQ